MNSLKVLIFFRFTEGESYHDLALRMGSLIFEVENGDNIAHESQSAKDIPTLELLIVKMIEISFGHYENKAVKLPRCVIIYKL